MDYQTYKEPQNAGVFVLTVVLAVMVFVIVLVCIFLAVSCRQESKSEEAQRIEETTKENDDQEKQRQNNSQTNREEADQGQCEGGDQQEKNGGAKGKKSEGNQGENNKEKRGFLARFFSSSKSANETEERRDQADEAQKSLEKAKTNASKGKHEKAYQYAAETIQTIRRTQAHELGSDGRGKDAEKYRAMLEEATNICRSSGEELDDYQYDDEPIIFVY